MCAKQQLTTDLLPFTEGALARKLYYLAEQEAIIQRYSVKKVLLEISQNSQENPCVRVS